MLQTEDHVLHLDPLGAENAWLTQAFIDKSNEWYSRKINPILREKPTFQI